MLYPWPQIADGTTDRLKRLLAASSVLVFSVPRRQIVQSFKLKYGFGGTGGGKNQRIPHSAKEKKRGFGFWSIKKNRCTAFCLKKVAFFLDWLVKLVQALCTRDLSTHGPQWGIGIGLQATITQK